jgi:hypothetical protein
MSQDNFNLALVEVPVGLTKCAQNQEKCRLKECKIQFSLYYDVRIRKIST